MKESRDRVATYETKDSVKEEVMVAVHDTVMEVTTITYVLRQAQEPNEPEDTVKTSIVTDRERGRSRDAIAMQQTKTEIVRDTVYVEKRDSVVVQTNTNLANTTNKPSGFIQTLKWIFWILICVIVLVIVFKVTKFINFFKV